jgi:hypothetical protein
MDEYEVFNRDEEYLPSHRRRVFTWLILLFLICSMLLPLISPLLREFYQATRPTPTPQLPLKVAQTEPTP